MPISSIARGQVFKDEGGGFLTLLTITHASIITPLRFVDNTVDITSNGELYIAYPFRIALPEDSEEAPPKAQLTLDNVTRDLTAIIRTITTPLNIDISVVRLDSLDDVEVSLPQFKMRNIEWDVLTISGDLTLDDVMNEPFPARAFTPSEYPGLF